MENENQALVSCKYAGGGGGATQASMYAQPGSPCQASSVSYQSKHSKQSYRYVSLCVYVEDNQTQATVGIEAFAGGNFHYFALIKNSDIFP